MKPVEESRQDGDVPMSDDNESSEESSILEEVVVPFQKQEF
jgi:hypothetical protein